MKVQSSISNIAGRWFFHPVPSGTLAAYRILFGFMMLWHLSVEVFTGIAYRIFMESPFHFPIPGFEWLKPLPGRWMYAWYAVLAVLSVMIMAGYRYRVASVSFFMLFSIMYCMDCTFYTYTEQLILWVSGFLMFAPAHVFASMDVKQGRVGLQWQIPRWPIVLLAAQMGIVYLYSGLGKISAHWLSGAFLQQVFQKSYTYWPIQYLYDKPVLIQWLAWGGCLFDVLITPALLWRKTRLPAFILVVLFHLFNVSVFSLGVLSLLCISLSAFFLSGESLSRFIFSRPFPSEPSAKFPEIRPKRAATLGLACILSFMALLPARHWLYPGDVLVTNEGHYFSWMLMMRTVDCDFMVKLEDAETGKQTLHDPRRFLPKEKYKMVAASPYRIWQYTRQLSAVYKKEGRVVPEMYIEHRAVVNGKDVSPVVKPGFDLAREPFPFFRHAGWISP